MHTRAHERPCGGAARRHTQVLPLTGQGMLLSNPNPHMLLVGLPYLWCCDATPTFYRHPTQSIRQRLYLTPCTLTL